MRLHSEAVSDVTRSPEVSNSDQSLGSTQNRKRKCRTKATPARRSASPRLASSRKTGARRDGVAKMVVTTIAFSAAMRVPETHRAMPHMVRGGTLYGGELSIWSTGNKGSTPEDSSQPSSEAFRIMAKQQSHSTKRERAGENCWHQSNFTSIKQQFKPAVVSADGNRTWQTRTEDIMLYESKAVKTYTSRSSLPDTLWPYITKIKHGSIYTIKYMESNSKQHLLTINSFFKNNSDVS